MSEWLRLGGPPLLALLAALMVDRSMARRELLPPAFQRRFPGDLLAPARRLTGTALLAVVLWIGVFSPLALLGRAPQFDPDAVSPVLLFLLHGIFAFGLLLWYVLGFAGSPHRFAAQFGFRAPSVARELALGVAAGLAVWFVVVLTLVLLGLVVWRLAGEELMPRQPPPMIPWIAALPIWLRLAVSLSAGLVEETFFRGFLQPRAGVAFASGLFVLAHLSYEQPVMLAGILLLSVILAFLVQWRQSVWAAATAHFVFDAVQLLVVIPWAMQFVEDDSAGGLLLLVLVVAGWSI